MSVPKKSANLGKLLLCIIFMHSPLVFSQEILISAKYENEPLSFEEQGHMQGIAYDIFSQIIKELKLPATIKPAGALPWKRNLLYLELDKIDVILGVEKDEGLDNILTFSGTPFYETAYSVFYLKERPVQLNNLTEKRGSISKDVSLKALSKSSHPLPKLSTSETRQQNILKLLNKRIDFFIAPLLPTIKHISEHHLEHRDRIAFKSEPIAQSINYLAYSTNSRLIPYQEQIDAKLKEYAAKGLITDRIGLEIANWNSFVWYLENVNRNTH